MQVNALLSSRLIGSVLLLGLSGCANPVEAPIEQQAGTHIDSSGDGMTIESEDGTVQVGTGTELPADFPAELPIPPGQLIGAVSGGGGWSLTYEGVERPEIDGLESAISGAGYEEVSRLDMSGVVQASYQGGQWILSLIWDGSEGSSKTLIYGVTPR